MILPNSTLQTATQILRGYDFFCDANAKLQQRILKHTTSVFLKSGEHFFKVGQRSPNIAFVGTGSVRVYTQGESGREITLYHVGPGETCPINLASGLLDIEVSANAVVENDLTAVLLPAALFGEWLQKDDGIRKFVLEALANRFSNIVSLVREIVTRRVDRRLASFLLSRFEISDDRPASLAMTHERIAGELGTAREVVSRLLSEMERSGAVTLARGRIYLKDDTALHCLLSKPPR